MTAKLERLQQLSRCPEFAELVPPLFPLLADAAVALLERHKGTLDTRVAQAAYASRLAQQYPALSVSVTESCGPAPWIVRSAGMEDSETFANAGGYASVVCRSSEALVDAVAAVTFSGFAPQAVEQQRLVASTYRPQPIAAFVQPLIESGPQGNTADETPYLSAADCARLFDTIGKLHRYFGCDALDTEWALQTDAGLVSATGLTLAGNDAIRGQIAFGFGFAAAQTPGSRPNSEAYHWPALAAPLWRGTALCRVRIGKMWLLQVRPAPGYELERRVLRLMEPVRAELTRRMQTVAVAPIIAAKQAVRGRFIAAATLGDAWSRYLELPLMARAEVVAVFVEVGVASEHAGIMFRQQGLPVLRAELSQLPAAPHAVVDATGTQAWFGSPTVQIALDTEAEDRIDFPPDVQFVFDDESSVPAALDSVADFRATSAEAIAGLLASLPAAIGPSRKRIERRSVWPARDLWLRVGDTVRSPSLFGRALARIERQALRAGWSAPSEAEFYVRAVQACIDPAASLFRLVEQAPRLAALLADRDDCRLALQLLAAERWAARLPAAASLPLARAALASCESVSAPSWLNGILDVLGATDELPIYDDEERVEIVRELVRALEAGIAPKDLLLAARSGAAAPLALGRLLRRPQAFAAYSAFLVPLQRFRSAGAMAGVAESGALLAAARTLEAQLQSAHLRTLSDLCRIDLVDTYDQVLKAVLADVVERRDRAAYDRYLSLLAGWIAFARAQIISAVDDEALASFLGWIETVRNDAMPEDFLLELDESGAARLGDDFLRWQALMPIAGGMAPRDLPLGNAHQLHNVLHQWMLAHFRVAPGPELPSGLRALLAIADGFGDTRSRLLRLNRAALEISLPIVVHKASFVFTADALTVEFAELPDAPADGVGRLLVFEALARRIGEWDPGWVVTPNRVCNLGTWTLYLRVRRTRGHRWCADDLPRLLIWFRVLFDCAYDFSYVPNSEVADAYARFGAAHWQEIFRALAGYRETVDLSLQRTTVYALPFATCLAALCLDEAVHQAVGDAYCAGFDVAWRAFVVAADRLHEPAQSGNRWASVYAVASQLGLLLSAAWPRETLQRMAHEALSPIAGERLCASLMHRRDISVPLNELIRGSNAPMHAALRELALRHAPAKVIDADNAAEVAGEVAGEARAFKRCKEYLLARYADRLPQSLRKRMIDQIDWVPRGVTPHTEARIERELLRVAQARGRFDIAEIDYVAAVRAFDADHKERQS